MIYCYIITNCANQVKQMNHCVSQAHFKIFIEIPVNTQTSGLHIKGPYL